MNPVIYLYKAVHMLPSGKLVVKYATDPKKAEELEGRLTCRLIKKKFGRFQVDKKVLK